MLAVCARKEPEQGVSGDWGQQASRGKCPKLFLQRTFSRQNFCRGIIQSQDMLHQDIWSVHISPRFILTVFHIDNPIKHMSALYLQWTCLFCKFVTQNTNTLGPAGPWPSGPRTSARGNTDIINIFVNYITWPKFWEQKFYANKLGSNFHNVCKSNQ